MASKSIPELLRHSLETHLKEADLRDDDELREIMGKLTDLSAKVAAAKAQVLARRVENKK